jgi:hypothetical protein
LSAKFTSLIGAADYGRTSPCRREIPTAFKPKAPTNYKKPWKVGETPPLHPIMRKVIANHQNFRVALFSLPM